VDTYFVYLCAGLVVVGLAGGFLTYTAHLGDDRTETKTQTVSSWQSVGEFTHRAQVTTATEPYAEGTVLDNRSIYFRTVSPILNGSFGYGYTASNGGNVTADVALSLVVRRVVRDEGGNTTVLWQQRRALNGTTATLAPGERVTVAFTTNVSRVAERAERVNEQFGAVPGETQIRVVARANLSGVRNGQPVRQTRTYRLPITVDQSVYRVTESGPVRRSDSRTRQVEVERGPEPIHGFGAPLLALVSLGAIGALVRLRTRDVLELSERERAWLTYRTHRAEFDDWITVGTVPGDALPDPRIEVDSLEGLVDVAIDCDRRVLEDATTGEFVVPGGDATYTYSPPREPTTRRGDG
jgi:hypothetical protein